MGYPHTKQLHLEELVLLEVEQEELHDKMLREEYREESVDCDSEEDNIHDFILVRCVILACMTPHIGHPASPKPVEAATTVSARFTSQTHKFHHRTRHS